MITREQAGALADFARTIRPAWDTRAIVSAIEEVRHQDIAAIAWALVKVAQDPQMKAPKSLTFEGDHWRRVSPSSPAQPKHEPERRPQLTETGLEAIAAARAAIRPMKGIA